MTASPPTFSVVVPTYRRLDQLRGCLDALAAIEYPRDRFEVIVVDDGGDAPLDPVVDGFRGSLDLTLVRQANAGPAAARNAGVGRARGDLVAFTDDDCRPEPGWLRLLGAALAETPGCMAGGRTDNVADGICPAMSQLIVDVVYRHYNADPMHARFLASNNMALPAPAFREAGGFDPSFRTAEDRELCDRWRHQGRPIVHVPAARVRHVHAMGPLDFCRQHFDYGRGAERFRRIRARRGSGTMLTEFAFHLDVRNWIGYPLRQVPLRQVPSVGALLGLWQAANLAGFVYEKVRGGRR